MQGKIHPAAERQRALHGADAGGVGVEAEIDVAGEPRETAQLLLGEGRPHARHHVGDAGLGESHDVGVALDHVHAVFLARRRLGLVEAEQGLALVVERRLRRVEVLGLLVAERARAEAERAPALVAEREHDAAAEAVVGAAALARDHEAGVEQVLLAEALGEGGRRAASPSPGGCSPHERRGRPRRPGRAARGTRAPARPPWPRGDALVVRGRLLEQRAQALAAPAVGVAARARLLVLERDAVPVGEVLDGLGEVEVLLGLTKPMRLPPSPQPKQ